MPHKDIDDVLRQWPFTPGDLRVRVVKARDGRKVLQMRVDLGLLQLEMSRRPDGERPGGHETYLDFLLAESFHLGEGMTLDEEQCEEIDREFVQYYHRRVCWLALREFEKAVIDADHTLAMMDFVVRHSPSEEWTASHEQYRPFVLFHRTQAAALGALSDDGPELAIERIEDGLDRLRDFFAEHEALEVFEEDELVGRLVDLRESLRDKYAVGKTLQEQLDEAVAAEEYELAARLRDEIRRRTAN